MPRRNRQKRNLHRRRENAMAGSQGLAAGTAPPTSEVRNGPPQRPIWYAAAMQILRYPIDNLDEPTQTLATSQLDTVWICGFIDVSLKKLQFLKGRIDGLEEKIGNIKKTRDQVQRALLLEEAETRQRIRERELQQTIRDFKRFQIAVSQQDDAKKDILLNKIKEELWAPFEMQELR